MTKRYVIAGILGPVAAWAALTVVGGKRADAAGTAIFSDRGLFVPVHRGLLLETIAAGLLVAYLTS